MVGGWKGLKELRDSGEKVRADERILGGSEFVERILRDLMRNGRGDLMIAIALYYLLCFGGPLASSKAATGVKNYGKP